MTKGEFYFCKKICKNTCTTMKKNDLRKKNSEEKVNLSLEKYEIKKYASFGLIGFSSHAKKRLKERNISSIDIFQSLCMHNASIVQFKEKGSYRNKYPRFVICSKCNKRVLHIIIEKKQINSTVHYEVVTAYEPSSKYFSHNGRIVKKACHRH